MEFQQTTFTRLFPSAQSGMGLITQTSFGFESGGKRFFDVTIHGRPRIEQGMTVIALLEKPDDWGGGGLLGWIDCFDGSIACDSAPKFFGLFLLSAFFAIMFPIRAYDIFGHPENATLVALFVVVLFGGSALRFLYLSAKALLVRRSLVTVRDLCEPKNAKFAANK